MSMKYVSYVSTATNGAAGIKKIDEYMSKYGVCAKPTSKSWIVFNTKKCNELKDEVALLLEDETDQLLVLEWSAKDHAVLGYPKDIEKWLDDTSRSAQQFS